MNMLAVDTPAAVAPISRRSIGDASAATYGSGPASRPPAPGSHGAWLRLAAERCRTPETRRVVMSMVELKAPELVRTRTEDARLLGDVLGAAEEDGLRALSALLQVAERPSHDWLEALFEGLADKWPRGLTKVVSLTGPRSDESRTLVEVLERCVLHRHARIRNEVVHALGEHAGRGYLHVLSALEREVLRGDTTPEERGRNARSFLRRGLAAIDGLLSEGTDVQLVVDVAVAMADVGLKAGETKALDDVLAKLDPSQLPVEVVLAFLTTTRPADARLPSRQTLRERFETTLRERRPGEADHLLQFAL